MRASIVWYGNIVLNKHLFKKIKQVELVALIAISQFNMGCVASLKTRKSVIRNPALSIAKKWDDRRLRQSIHLESKKLKMLTVWGSSIKIKMN